jgi:hypothetical protein
VKKGSGLQESAKDNWSKNSPEITGFFVEKSGATAPLALLGSKSSTCARAAGLPALPLRDATIFAGFGSGQSQNPKPQSEGDPAAEIGTEARK